MKTKKRICSVVLLSLVSFMSSGLLTQNNVASSLAKKDAIIKGGKAYSDYETEEEVIAAGNSLNETIAEEGVVLLKNKDNDLPYEGIKRVSVFGKGSVDLIYGGTGSGGGNSTDAKTVFDSLNEVGIEYNPVLKNFYEDDNLSGTGAVGGDIFGSHGSTIGETPIEDFDRSIDESTNIYNDAAIIVISRGGGEGFDLDRVNAVDYKGDEKKSDYVQSHYLELSKNEKATIEYVKARFNKITVVINSAEAMELGTLKDDDKITSMLWLSTPGNSGVMALGRILTGKVNPSRRLVDTYARDFTKDPTWENFGNNTQTSPQNEDGTFDTNYFAKDKDGNLVPGFKIGGIFGDFVQSSAVPYVQYEEGIYYGYNYYETRGHDEGEAWYKSAVAYPFGYGLSYTTFTQSIVSNSLSSGSELSKNGKLDFTVRVTNTGSVSGKDVVQLYYTAPYDKTTAPIEKAHVKLGAFSKTKLLKPGESQDIKLSINVQDMASYDYLDSNSNDHAGYELDKGTYSIKLLNNAHDVEDKDFASKKFSSIDYTVSNVINYDTDRITGSKVENRFTGEDSIYKSTPYAADMKQTELSRSDWNGTWPKQPDTSSADDRTKEGSKLAERLAHVFSLDDFEGNTDDPRYITKEEMAGKSQIKESTPDSERTHTLMLKDMVDVNYDDAKWDTLLNELKYSEMIDMVRTGLYHVGSLDAIGKNQAVDSDGPASIYKVRYASETLLAATFNTDLINKQGQMIGNEALFAGKSGWYGPAMNMHRSPFGGRNFEYFAEDPLLSGKMAAAEIQGAQSKGLYAYAKHFAVNDQETSRQGVSVYVNEQALREVYLKPFQYVVQEGETLGIMTSFNKIGNVDAACNYQLITGVLRDEWGFKGAVVTDGYSGTGHQAYMNLNNMFIAGGDLPLGDLAISEFYGSWDDEKGTVVYDSNGAKKESYSYWNAIRRATKSLLYAAVHSNQMNNMLDLSSFTSMQLTAAKDVKFSQSVAVDFNSVGTKNIAYRVTDGQLPEGYSLSKDGTLSGTTSTFGTYKFTITMSCDNWVKSSKEFTLDVVSAFNYNGTDMANAKVKKPFEGKITSDVIKPSENPTTDGGYSKVEYAVADNSSLPLGLEIDGEGNISGIPLVSGDFTTRIAVTAYTLSLDFTTWTYLPVPHVFYVDYDFHITPTPYVVTFNANYDGGANTTVSVLDGETVDRPLDLARDGYIFKGWFKDKACTQPVDFNSAISNTTTYYAGWAKEGADTTEIDNKIAEIENKIDYKTDNKSSDMNGGTIAAIILSSISIVGIVGLVIWMLMKKKAVK